MQQLLLDGLRGLGVVGLPFLLIGAGVCSMAAWQPGTEPAATLELLFAALVFGVWALWSFLTGPERFRSGVFGVASVMSAVQAANVLMNGRPHHIEIGAVFLACSLWQFFIFHRRATGAPME